MRQDFVLVCDLGGTSLRVALVDTDGLISALYRMPLESGCEADPDGWWDAFCDAADTLMQTSPDSFAQVRAIAISAFTRSQVFLDAEGKSLRPAILWADTRASGQAQMLSERCPPSHPEAAALNAYHPLARLYWLQQEEPESFGRLKKIVEPKDYLNFRLTGELAGDDVSMARLVASAEGDQHSLFAMMGLDPDVIPTLLEPTDVVGTVLPELRGALGLLAGSPVMAMANDSWASVVGLGAMRPDMAYNISGTTEVLGVLSPLSATAEGLLTVRWGPDLVQIGGPSQTGADALAWLLGGVLGHESLESLLKQPRAAEALLFLPYLQGERVPYWDPSLRGAFVGLNRRHRAVDMAWAVMEGVAFQNRIVLERAEAALGRPVAEIRYGGGGAACEAWRQVKADILNRPIVITAADEPGLIGAAILAWTGLGRYPDLGSAQTALAPALRRYEPDPSRVDHYSRLYRLFRETEQALAPISRALAGQGDRE